MDYYLVCVYILTGIIGLCVGSFLNVVIYRLPMEMSLAVPSSHCTSCGYSLKWYDNIPIISYLLLGGKCRKCREHISVRYTLVELFNMLFWLLSVFCFWQKSPLFAAVSAIVCSCLICVFCIDMEHMLIFDRFVILISLAGIVIAVSSGDIRWYDHIIGAIVGGGIFALLYYGSIAVLKKEGLGLGDVKLSFAIGLLLGWQKYILAMLISSVIGSVVLIMLNRISGKDKSTEHPFGPFMTVGTAVAMFLGDMIIEWYMNILL